LNGERKVGTYSKSGKMTGFYKPYYEAYQPSNAIEVYNSNGAKFERLISSMDADITDITHSKTILDVKKINEIYERHKTEIFGELSAIQSNNLLDAMKDYLSKKYKK
jgi:hypothetical protein